jgi:diguanylate cyclase (GGDEF)-like protein
MAVADPGREPLQLQAAIEAELARGELEIYKTTAGVVQWAAMLEERALASKLDGLARRARLLRSDALSRQGELAQALRIQLETLTEAELDADRPICARAHCQLASTYDRLADPGKALVSAEESVRLLAAGDPPVWQAEHMMVLALFTSYRRYGSIDYTTFDEAVRLAAEAGEPLLQLAVLNNYVYVALIHDDPRGVAMVEQMRALIEREVGDSCPSAWLDTIALGLLAAGRLDEAAEVSEAAVRVAPEDLVEPSSTAMCILTQAKVERASGNLAGAAQKAEAAVDFARRAGATEAAVHGLAELAELAALDGDYRRAYELLSERNREWDRFQTERSELHAVTLQAIYAVEVERQRRLALEALADSDPLTGLFNRRYMTRQLAQLVQSPVALALVDIDHFKQINDRFSHEAGDRVLMRLASILTAGMASAGHGAFAARIGGEEFVLAFSEGDTERARERCERIRAEVEGHDWNEVAVGLRVTVSVGLAVDRSGGGEGSALLGRADAQLYRAKRQGRNRVILEAAD